MSYTYTPHFEAVKFVEKTVVEQVNIAAAGVVVVAVVVLLMKSTISPTISAPAQTFSPFQPTHHNTSYHIIYHNVPCQNIVKK